MDLNPYTRPEDYYSEGLISCDNLITASAKNKMNIDYIKERLYTMVIDDPTLLDQTVVTNNRHYEALNNAYEALSQVLNGLTEGMSGDLIALDIRQALHHLGLITGEISTDDLLESIFSSFCIGK
jgi:tRNA modification GTPase